MILDGWRGVQDVGDRFRGCLRDLGLGGRNACYVCVL